jgi:excisionase family DNA binding protein
MTIPLASKPDGRLRQFYTRQQVAKALQLHIHTIRALINRKELTAVAVAGQVRIPCEELERYLQRSRIGRPFHPDTHPRRNDN